MKLFAGAALAVCVLVPVAAAQRGGSAVLVPPTLATPSGAIARGTNVYTGEISAGRFYWLGTDAPAGSVTDQLRKSLNALGWRETFAEAASAFSLTRFQVAAASGPQVGVLTVFQLAPREIVASIRLLRDVPSTSATGRLGGGGAGAQSAAPLPAEVAMTQLLADFPAPAPADEGFAQLSTVPQGFPARLLPDGFKFHKGMRSQTRTTVVGSVANATATELAPYMTEIRQAGWHERTLAGGFYEGTVSAAYCDGKRVVDLAVISRPDRIAIVAVSLNNASSGICPQTDSRQTTLFAMPFLYVWPEWDPEHRRVTVNPGHRRTEVRLTTSLTPAELWDRYQPAMKVVGFGLDARVGDSSQLASRFSTKGDAVPATAILAFTVLPDSKRIDASLDVFRIAGR